MSRCLGGIGLAMVQLLAQAEAQESGNWIRPYASWGAGVGSVPYRIDAVRSGDPARLNANADIDPKVSWLHGLKLGVRVANCGVGVQQTQLGYVNTTRETVDIWRQLEGDGYQVAPNSTATVGYRAFSMTGVGGVLECDFAIGKHWTITAGANQSRLSHFRFADYSGTVGASGGANQFNYSYTKWGHDPYMDPSLQASGTARASWLNARGAWKSDAQPLSFTLDLPVLVGRVNATQAPYVTESLNLTEVNGQFHNNSGNIASGRYANLDVTHRLPTFWGVELNYAASDRLSPIYHAQGVGGMRSHFVGNRWTVTDSGRGVVDLLVEPSSRTLLLRGGSDSWTLGIGVATRRAEDLRYPLMLQWQVRYN